MKSTRLLLAFAACLAPAFAAYTYDYANLLNPYTSSNWTSHGTNSVSTNMYTSSATTGGSLIFQPALPAPTNNYELRFTLALTANGGNYITYLRASSNAQLVPGGTSTGTFYAVEFANPVLSNGYYTATLNIYKCVNGSVSSLYNNPVYPHNGTVVRVVFNVGNGVAVFLDNNFWGSAYDQGTLIASGQPGVGVTGAPSGNGMTTIDIGHLDTTPPSPVNPQLVGTSVYPNHVSFQFPGSVDDPNGSGLAFYQYYRNTVNYIGMSAEPNFEDTTVSAGTPYSYTVQAVDFHGNISESTVNVTTAPTGAIDPREVGVRPTGTYWGSGGEQIDMRSGNLNFTVPIIKAMSRGGRAAAINLSYNSQNWRQDSGGEWQLGRDVGLGYGWRLQLASLTPVYSNYFSPPDHYLFIDSTGGEYSLYVDSNGIWSSKESNYVYYDPTTLELHFTDGSYWVFGCTSAGTEQDAGTMYPSDLYDSNGNVIAISYASGVGVPYSYSSSRIYSIDDVRGNGAADYNFTYTTVNGAPHLTGITNTIGTAENYTFGYATNTLTAPFTPATGYGTWAFLSSVANNIPLTTSFAYDSSGSGELHQVTFPYGGHIRWAYGPFTYTGSRTLREVNAGRFLAMSATASELTYSLLFSGGATLTFHAATRLDDPDGQSEKAWSFDGVSTDPGFGLANSAQNRLQHTTVTGETMAQPTWSLDAGGNPYVSSVYTYVDYDNPTALAKQTNQTVDQYGNVTQTQIYGYGPVGSNLPLLRTYTNTYLNNPTYTPLYILNRLLTSTVTDGTNTTTLVTNSYDQTTPVNATGIYEHSSQYGTSWRTRGNATTSVTPSGTTLVNYDIAGNVTLTDVNGLSTSNTLSTTTNYAAPSTITTNSLSASIVYNSNGSLGLTSVTNNPNGDNLAIAYDANNRPHTTTSPTGAVTTYTYNDNPSPPTLPNKIATTNGHWVQTYMDGFGRTVKTSTGYGTTTVSQVDTVYVPCGCSPIGKMGQQSAPYYNSLEYWTTYTYDGLGRTTQKELPDGSITHYSYAGNSVTVADAAGITKTFTTDALGNLTQVQEPDPVLGTVSTNYTYDMLNHLTQVSMPRGSNTQTRSFNYTTGTTVGINLLSATNPENGTVSYTYNSDQTLNTKTDAKGQVFTYLYDSYKRLITIKLGSTVLRTFIYDTNTLDSSYSGSYTAGRLVAVQNAAFTPQGYVPGQGGSNVTVPSSIQFVEMYNYTQAGLTAGKRLQAQETFHWYVNNVLQTSNQTLNMDGTYTYDTGGEGKIKSVTYPTTYSNSGSGLVPNTGPTYTYSFDAMYRPTGLTDQNNNTLVNNVSYNPANQLLTFNAETRSYNNLNQMTRLTITGSAALDISYNFPAGANNGKINSQKDNLSVETVTYQYDSLNRLLSASSSQSWSETYGFDSFGNLLSKTPMGGAPTLSQSVDTTTNRIVGQTYDSNGNQLSGPLGTVTYDAENRVASMSSGGVQYAYDSRNKRVWSSTLAAGNLSQNFYYYGVDGQKLAIYPMSLVLINNVTPLMTDNTNIKLSQFFGSKRVGTYDRLGTAKYDQQNNGPMSFYPYGEDRGTVQPNDSLKFATYTRDTATGLDYADQRYYASNWGRFMSPDPYIASVGPASPTSWNRYSYTRGDPVNRFDPGGNADFSVTVTSTVEDDEDDGPAGDGGAGAMSNQAKHGANGDADQKAPHIPGAAGPNPGYLFGIDKAALLADASQFAKQLLSGDISQPCADDIKKLGIDADTWAEALSNVNILNGIGSTVPYASVLPYGSSAWATATQRNLTVGGNFRPNSGTMAMASVNGNEVWINPSLVNPGYFGESSALIAHEVLHNLGLTDPMIQTDLNIAVTSNSINIGNKIQTDCFPGPAGTLLY